MQYKEYVINVSILKIKLVSSLFIGHMASPAAIDGNAFFHVDGSKKGKSPPDIQFLFFSSSPNPGAMKNFFSSKVMQF